MRAQGWANAAGWVWDEQSGVWRVAGTGRPAESHPARRPGESLAQVMQNGRGSRDAPRPDTTGAPEGDGQTSDLNSRRMPHDRRVQKAGLLRRSVVESLIFLTITTLVGRGSQIVATLVLTKILSVSDFGVVNIVGIIITSFMLVRTSFFFQTLMHRQTHVRESADVAFWGAVISGFGLWMLAIVTAPAIAGFFRSPLVGPVLGISALAFFISSIGLVPDTLFEKELQFRRKSLAEAAQPLIYSVVAVGLALARFGVYSFVWAEVVSSAVWAVWIFAISPYRPSFTINWKVCRELLSYGRFVFGAAVVGLIFNNIDNASVARFLGAQALGFYALAFVFANFAAVNLTGLIVSSVVLPVFSKLQNDIEAQRRALDSTLRYVGLYTAPFTIGLIVLAPVFMHALYGHKWDGAIAPLQILAIYGWAGSYGTVLGSMCNGLGKARAMAWITYFRLVLVLPLIYWAPAHFFVAGTAWNFTIAKVVGTLISLIYMQRLLKFSIRIMTWRLIQPLLVAMCAGAGVLVFHAFIHVNARLALGLEAVVFMAIFVAVYALIDPRFLVEAITMPLRRHRGRQAPDEPITMALPALIAAPPAHSLARPARAGSGDDLPLPPIPPADRSLYNGDERPTLRPMRLVSLDEIASAPTTPLQQPQADP